MRAHWLLLLFLIRVPSGFTAEVTAPTCAPGYRDLATGGAPLYNKERRVLDRHARFSEINDADNARFIGLAEKANVGEPTPAKLFLFSENAVLKELNDKVVEDKDLVTALTNLRKHLEHFHLQLDPELQPHLVGQYSDFKVHQIALDTADPALVRKLETKMAEMNRRYGEYLLSIAEARGWRAKGSGLAQNSQSWFHAGRGLSPDEAALAARDSRSATAAGAVPRLRSFAEARKGLEQAARKTELLQGWAEKRFAGTDGFLSDAGNGKRVVSAEAIEAMKKVTPLTPTAEGYRQAVQEVLHKRFGLTLSDREADALKEYLALADRFSPALLLEKRVVIDMAQPAAAVVSADFKGQNARNLEETLKALARTAGEPLGLRVKEVRRGEAAATAMLEAKKARFARVLERVKPGVSAQFSGDDGMGFLTAPFSEAEKQGFARAWIADGGGPEDLRLTFEEFRYKDSGGNIPGEVRSRFVVSAESVEKKLREKLLGPLERRELNGTQILVSLEGMEQGPARVNLLLLNAAGEKPGVPGLAKAIAESLGFQVGRVEMRAP